MPTMKVEAPMITMVIRKVYLRSTISPGRPKTGAPKGAAGKPAAKAGGEKIIRVDSSYIEKNFNPMMAAREP